MEFFVPSVAWHRHGRALGCSPMAKMSTLSGEYTNETERLVSDRELAATLGISRRHVHSLRARGLLRAVFLGAAVRFPVHENLERVLRCERPLS